MGRGGAAEPGVFPYFCSHDGTAAGQGMAGVVVVGDVPDSPGAKGRIEPVAVEAADPGDLVLIDAGVSREEVTVTTPSLVIQGVDRNAVIIDGEFVHGDGITVLADAVALENLTARNALLGVAPQPRGDRAVDRQSWIRKTLPAMRAFAGLAFDFGQVTRPDTPAVLLEEWRATGHRPEGTSVPGRLAAKAVWLAGLGVFGWWGKVAARTRRSPGPSGSDLPPPQGSVRARAARIRCRTVSP